MRYIISFLLFSVSAFGQCGLLRFNPITFTLDCTGLGGGVTTTAGAVFGAFTYDFTGSTVGLPSVFLRSDTGWTMTAGQKMKGVPSATVAGFGIAAGSVPSALVTGDLGFSAAGVHWSHDGTNVNYHPYVAGSGVTPPTAPTVGHCSQWGAAFSLTDVVCPTGATPAGSGSELQYRSNGTTFAALANSSVPNAGEILLTTTPALSATRSVHGLGSAIAAGRTAANTGTYHGINSGASFIGDFLHFEKAGALIFQVNPTAVANATQLWFGTHDAAGMLQETDGSGNMNIKAGDGTFANGSLNVGNMNVGNSGVNNFQVRYTGVAITYNGQSTVGVGMPSILATINLTAQSAAIAGGTALYTPAATGMFRVSYYAKVTTAGTTSILGGTTGLILAYTDGSDSVAQTAFTLPEDNQAGTALSIGTGNTTNTNQAVIHGSAVIFALTGVPITYAFGYTSTGTAMVYELHVRVESI